MNHGLEISILGFRAGPMVVYLLRLVFLMNLEDSLEDRAMLVSRALRSLNPEKIPVSWVIPFFGTGTQNMLP
jgi:hypothetical protein